MEMAAIIVTAWGASVTYCLFQIAQYVVVEIEAAFKHNNAPSDQLRATITRAREMML